MADINKCILTGRIGNTPRTPQHLQRDIDLRDFPRRRETQGKGRAGSGNGLARTHSVERHGGILRPLPHQRTKGRRGMLRPDPQVERQGRQDPQGRGICHSEHYTGRQQAAERWRPATTRTERGRLHGHHRRRRRPAILTEGGIKHGRNQGTDKRGTERPAPEWK